MPELEPPMKYITLSRASELSGVSAATLGNQSRSGKLRTVDLGNIRVTTRAWLHEYLTTREHHQGRRLPLPEGYIAPGDATIVRVYRSETHAGWAGEANEAAQNGVHTVELVAKMSDGSFVSLALFHAGRNSVSGDELIGKTLTGAQDLIKSRGETIRGAVAIEGED